MNKRGQEVSVSNEEILKSAKNTEKQFYEDMGEVMREMGLDGTLPLRYRGLPR
jgi:hypothetical protein